MAVLDINDFIGKKFGMLTVIGEAKRNKQGAMQCTCLCDCGKTCVKLLWRVKTGYLKSCGCLLDDVMQKFKEHREVAIACADIEKAKINFMAGRYIIAAKETGRDFSLSFDEIKDLIYSHCHYCGRKPAQKILYHGSAIIYNGIDRVDNSKGYIPGNCVSCCCTCNFGKRNLSYDAFIEYLYTIARKYKDVALT